ncbi:MAG: DapH/DapD/GlmU-related protein [Clostridia bacterium]|nr:DapH/DapD/GlmU-related protein [Clostridia bacterium]
MTKFFVAINMPKDAVAEELNGVKILGKTAEEIIINEFNESEKIDYCDSIKISNKKHDTVMLLPSFPFTTQRIVDYIFAYMEKFELTAVNFRGGTAVKKGGDIKNAATMLIDCGPKFTQIKDFSLAVDYARKIILKKHIENGVFIESEKDVSIDYGVKIANSAKICRFTVIKGETKIGENTVVGPFCDITDSILGQSVKCVSSTLIGATVGNGTTVGPYSYLRQNSFIGENCRIGDFVEIKNSVIGNGTKVSHLAYVGDATIGEKVNVGCGVVFVNYDGKNKNRTTVGDGSFLGSNCNFIAPITIGKNVFVAAGSTVTKNLIDNDFCVAREREYIKHDWKRP